MTDQLFDAIAYFQQMATESVTCQTYGFRPTTCSGPDSVEGVMQQFRRTANFVMVSDTVDSNTHSIGEGFFRRSVYTVWILAAYRRDDMADREEKLNLCRTIFRQFLSRMLYDKERATYEDQMEFLDLTRVYSTELGRYAMNGVTGLYFMVNSDEPIDIQYDPSLWQKQQ